MRWETKISLTLATMIALFSPTGAPSAKAQAKKPNIVFILVDNVGWGNFGVYRGTVPTPRIDKLASEGIRFNNYNVEVQCTPSRSAIMTGRHPVRSGTYTVPLPGEGKAGMAPWEYTIAKLLSDAGYATALYGKWHLGNTPAIRSAYLKPQFPMMFDLSSDPHEDNNLFYTDLTNGALIAPALKVIYEYERSVKEYPNIKVGEDFKGYKK